MHGDIFKESSRLDLHIVAFMWARHAMKSPICKVHEVDDMDMGGDWIAGCHVNVFAEKKKPENFSHNTQKIFMSPLMQRDQPLTSWHVRFGHLFSCFLLWISEEFGAFKIFGGKQVIIGLSSWSVQLQSACSISSYALRTPSLWWPCGPMWNK